MPYAFGVDGGASNSRAVISTLQGEVLHVAKGPGVNYHEVGASKVISTLHQLYTQCLEAARAKPEECLGACFGLAGVGREQDRATLTPLLDDRFGKDRFLLTSDAEIALSSGTLSETGILVLAGTGSMVYGKNEGGAVGRVGGYGPILSDEGSGYHIGQEALRAVIRHYDGFDAPTILSQRVLEHLALQTVEELISWTNSATATRERVASIAPLVIRAANEDDPVADEIIHRQADALALQVEVLAHKLNMPERVEVVLSGGLLANASFYWQVVRRKVLYFMPAANVITPKLEPALGALLYALASAKEEINEDLLSIIRRTFQDVISKSKNNAT